MSKPHQHQESPVDLPGSVLIGGHPLAWTTGVIATASLFLLLTNAKTIHDWAVELEPSPTTVQLVDLAAQWEAFTAEIGLGATRAGVHAAWKDAQSARFGNEGQAGAE